MEQIVNNDIPMTAHKGAAQPSLRHGRISFQLRTGVTRAVPESACQKKKKKIAGRLGRTLKARGTTLCGSFRVEGLRTGLGLRAL